MTPQKSKFITVLLVLATASAVLSAKAQPIPAFKKLVFIQQQLEINVEIAATQAEREHGLMYRGELDTKQGMLFIYNDLGQRSVWMKNTLIPLDVLFLAEDGSILSMIDNLPPCKQDPCTVYDSNAEAKFMLELTAGFIKQNHLKIGQKLHLPK